MSRGLPESSTVSLPWFMAAKVCRMCVRNNRRIESDQLMQPSYGPAAPTCASGTIVHVLVAPLTDAPVVTPPASLPFTLPLHAEMIP